MSVGVGNSLIAFTLSGCALRPLDQILCHMYNTSLNLSLVFSKENLRFRSSALLRSSLRFLLWSQVASSCVLPFPITRKSSAITTTPLRPSTTFCILCCQTIGAELIQNGILFQQYRPKGVLNMVNRLDCSSSLICQTPARASNTENTFAFANLVEMSSMVGNG